MPFEKVQPEKLSTAVIRQIELLILRGILRPGQHTVCSPETPMNDLHLALIRRVGREAESFGDSREALGEV